MWLFVATVHNASLRFGGCAFDGGGGVARLVVHVVVVMHTVDCVRVVVSQQVVAVVGYY